MKRETTPPLATSAWLVLCSTLLLSAMNSSMTTVALPDMQTRLAVTPDRLTWAIVAFLIPFAAGTVIYSRLGEMFNTRTIYLSGLTLFSAASLAVATAPSFDLLVVARVAQGLGGVAVPAIALATIVRTTNPRDRARDMAFTVVTVGFGFGLGPVVGGILTEWATWRAPFIAASCAGFILLPAVAATVPALPGFAARRFDYLGAVLFTAAVTCDIIALNRLPVDSGDPAGLISLAVSLPLWAGVARSTVKAAVPFLDMRLTANPRFTGLAGVGFAAHGAHFAVIVLIPLLLARYYEMGAVGIGLHLVPGAVALAFFGLVGGSLANKIGAGLLLVIGAWIVFVAALTFHLAGVGWQPWGIALLYALLASGFGMINACIVNSATADLNEDLTGAGVGMFNLWFFLGGASAVALAGAILQQRSAAFKSLNPIFPGRPFEFSDAMLVVTGFAAVGFILALRFAPLWRPARFAQPTAAPASAVSPAWATRVSSRKAPAPARSISAPAAIARAVPTGIEPQPAETWAMKPRLKPNMRGLAPLAPPPPYGGILTPVRPTQSLPRAQRSSTNGEVAGVG